MENDLKDIPSFDDIIFEIRNKDYGAYSLRKKYDRNVSMSLLIGVAIMTGCVITPYLKAKSLDNRLKHAERQVEINIEKLDQPIADVIPPPPPPPPADVVQQVKYIPPVVVDSVKPDETSQLMTADQAQVEVKNDNVVNIIQEVKEEVKEGNDAEPFYAVEEMPEPEGGIPGLMKYIAENLKYPEADRENNIQGKVVVRFCINSKGGIERVSVYRSVDPGLDAEAIRVVKTLPAFKPGREAGRPVPVWYMVPIIFKIKKSA